MGNSGWTNLPRLVEAGHIDTSVFSHLVRRAFEASGQGVSIAESNLQRFTHGTALPKPVEQRDNLILWIGSTQANPAAWALTDKRRLAAIVGCAIAAPDQHEPGLHWLITQLSHEFLFGVDPKTGQQVEQAYQLTMVGWNLYNSLLRREIEGRNAFMAMDFNDSDIDEAYDKCFKPAAKRAGFDLRKLNEGQAAGLIDNQLRARIRSTRIVVADLSTDNSGAYFEAGLAEGFGVSVV
jgi:hypothetical protein